MYKGELKAGGDDEDANSHRRWQLGMMEIRSTDSSLDDD
jgi:hypothetical protein